MLTHAFATWLVTTIGLIVLTELPLGVRIDTFKTAAVAAAVLGLLNAFLLPILRFFTFPLTLLTFGLFSVVLNALIFVVAAGLVDGFELRRGCLSAVLAPIVLGILNSILFAVFG